MNGAQRDRKEIEDRKKEGKIERVAKRRMNRMDRRREKDHRNNKK